jgi:hypothetical protein
LLLAVSLVAAGHRVALFERGTYCPRLDGAAFMRILKSPEHFALQLVSLEGVRADVFRKLAVLLGRKPEERGIRAVVDPLIRFCVDLPLYVQRSAELTSNARNVRAALSKARSPVDLLFSELPTACGMEPFRHGARPNAKRSNEFVERLDSAVTELRGCYPKLLETMRAELFQAIQVESRIALAERASALSFRVHEQQLKTFVLRLADEVLSDDPWTEALASAVLGKAPSRWLDHDVVVWGARLADLAAQFKRVEAAAFGSADSKRNAVRVSLTRVDGMEHAVIVDIDKLSDDQTTVIGTIERLALEAKLSLDQVAALLSLQSMKNLQNDVATDVKVERDIV